MKNINPTNTQAWKNLQKHFQKIKKTKIADLFSHDKNRFINFSNIFDNKILIDYSKNLITKETIKKLLTLAEECFLKEAISSMFCGEKINYTENQPVLHIALRNKSNYPILVNGKNIMLKINSVLNKMKNFCKCVISGDWKGSTNKPITDIINIGIGGSGLGPYMVTEALQPYKNHLSIHFISNIDGTNVLETLKNLNPETTLCLIASKTFTTLETITNARSVLNWFHNLLKEKFNISNHFIALSSNVTEVKNFGINPSSNMFKFWDWVGGRYSVWSSAGLSIMLSIGPKNFEKFLHGAHAMDQHFYHTSLKKNIPIILALIGIWYNNFFKMETEAILPYDQYMHQFAAYIQQSNMESNGKSTDRNGDPISYQTGPIVWGATGTNGQHSFYQLIHQGTKIIPCDFIVPIISHNNLFDHHIKLLSNFFAQTEALAFGNSNKLKHLNLNESNLLYDKNNKHTRYLEPFKSFNGNRPSNSILLQKINPYNLGALIALYEHKIFTQGVILNIYSFDQWGVELGKKLAKKILLELKNDNIISSHDSSTNGLINCYKRWKK